MKLLELPVKVANVQELLLPNPQFDTGGETTNSKFIEANTTPLSVRELKDEHIIPVFVKDNEPVISHCDFIETTHVVVQSFFAGETVLSPAVRVSHPIKGRIPESKNKPASELLEWEKTLYYERLAFIIEIPTIHEDINGNRLNLTVGGVKAYNLDNLYNKKGVGEKFKIFIGFQNKICTNLCIWTDGFISDVTVSSIAQLEAAIKTLIQNYNARYHLHSLKELCNYSITEKEFAHLVGKCRMYQHLPPHLKADLPKLSYGDNQLGMICKDYYKDESFCKDEDGNINLWQLYNLFTGSNKSSYIDTFLDKGANAFHFVDSIRNAKANNSSNWFITL